MSSCSFQRPRTGLKASIISSSGGTRKQDRDDIPGAPVARSPVLAQKAPHREWLAIDKSGKLTLNHGLSRLLHQVDNR